MSEDKNMLDDFLKRKLNSKQFELKDSYWDNARKMIDEDRSREQKGIFLFLISMTTVLVVSIGMIFAESYEAIRKQTATVYAEKASPVAASHSWNPFENITSESFYSTVGETSAVVKEDLSRPADNSSLTHYHAVRTTNSNSKPDKKIAVALKNASPEKAHTTKKRVNHKKRNHSIAQTAAITYEEMPIEGDQISNADQKEISGLYTIPYPNVIENRSYKPYDISVSLSDTSLKKKDVYLQQHERTKQQRFLTVVAGLNAYNPSGNVLNAVNFHTGFNYYYFVHPRIALSAGLIYSRLHQDLPERTYENTYYSFGKTTGTTSIKTLRLDYIELPVNVHYNIFKQHYITGGASFGYLLQSTERIITSKDVETQQKDNGHKQPINPYEIQLNAGYMIFLPKGFNLSLGYYYGLGDVSKNDWFKSNQLNRNSGIRLSVGYRLF